MIINHIVRIWHGSRRQNVGEHRTRCSDKQGRCGLTLIEILIATVLMAALLVAMWRLIGIYTSLRGKGDSHAERVGNVSLMLQQLEEDLRVLPEIRPQPTVRVQTDFEVESAGVDRELIAFDEAYDDEPAVETVSESAIELEESGSRSSAMSHNADLALPKEDSFNSMEGPVTDNLKSGNYVKNQFGSGPTVRQQAHTYQNRSEDRENSQLIDRNSAAASCLVGDEQSLTLANLRYQVSHRIGERPDRFSHDLLAESGKSLRTPDNELSGESSYGSGTTQYGVAPNISGESVTQQMPAHFVRYWLASVIPLFAQTSAPAQNKVDTEEKGSSYTVEASSEEAGTVGTNGEQASDERASGLYREEIVEVTLPKQLRLLRSRNFPGILNDRSFGEQSSFSGTSGSNLFEGQGHSEEVVRRSFHLSQVEWVKFRYFDGNQWTSTWDSRVRGELPVAIEMSLWLLQLNATQQTTNQVTAQNPPAIRGELTRKESNPISELQAPYSIADQELQIESGEFSSIADDNPMERQPEIRQLVVLRSAPQ